jgi:hypothetical protein
MQTFEDVCNSEDSVSIAIIECCYSCPDRAVKLVESVFNSNIPHNRKLEIINYQRDSNDSILHTAVAGESMRLIRLLLEKGANPNVVDESMNLTPILASSHHPKRNCITKLLLAHGADPNISDIYGRTCLYHSLVSIDYPMAKFLLLVGGRIHRTPLYRNIIHHLRGGPRRHGFGDWRVMWHNCGERDNIVELVTKYHIHVSLRQIAHAHIQLHVVNS